MYLLYLKWVDSYVEILAICDELKKAKELKRLKVKSDTFVKDYIRIKEINIDKLYDSFAL